MSGPRGTIVNQGGLQDDRERTSPLIAGLRACVGPGEPEKIDQAGAASSYGHDPLLEGALWTVARIGHVFPVHSCDASGLCSCRKTGCPSPGKHPRIQDWSSKASSDPDTVRAWWRRWPAANMGVPTGAVSGIVVLDVDGEIGAASLAELERKHGPLPKTFSSLTGGGGQHFLFLHNPRHPIRNKARFLGFAGIDVRGDGGYVVVPPSIHASGRSYTWKPRSGPHDPDVPLAELPEWMLPSASGGADGSTGSPRLAPAVGEEIPEGMRHDTLMSIAGSMRRRGLGASEIEPTLLAVNANRCRPSLDRAEVHAIAEGVSQYPNVIEPPRSSAAVCVRGSNWLCDASITLADLAARKPEPPPSLLGDGLLPIGGLALLTGRPGLGKTWAILDLGLSVAAGKPWLGKVPTGSPRRVGLALFELPSWSLLPRVRAVSAARGLGLEVLANVSILTPDAIGCASINVLDARVETALREWARRFDLVVLDALQRTHTVPENDADKMGPVLGIRPAADGGRSRRPSRPP